MRIAQQKHAETIVAATRRVSSARSDQRARPHARTTTRSPDQKPRRFDDHEDRKNKFSDYRFSDLSGLRGLRLFVVQLSGTRTPAGAFSTAFAAREYETQARRRAR